MWDYFNSFADVLRTHRSGNTLFLTKFSLYINRTSLHCIALAHFCLSMSNNNQWAFNLLSSTALWVRSDKGKYCSRGGVNSAFLCQSPTFCRFTDIFIWLLHNNFEPNLAIISMFKKKNFLYEKPNKVRHFFLCLWVQTLITIFSSQTQFPERQLENILCRILCSKVSILVKWRR